MKKIIAILVGVIVLVIVLWLIYTIRFVSWDFRNNLWAPAYLLWRGESAYDIKIMFENSNSIWFPQVIGVFSLLGLLPQYPATNLWLILNIVFLLTLIGFLFRQNEHVKLTPLHLGILILTVSLFPPTVRHLILGQVDILLMVSMIAAMYAIEKNQFILGGFLFSLALTKPQHCIVVLPSVIVYLLLNEKTGRDTLKLLLATGFSVILQTVPLWLSNLSWYSDFLSNLEGNPNWVQPGIFSMLYNKFGVLGVVFWLTLYLIILLISFQIWSKHKPQKAILWSLALTAIISPYLWSWDFVLLLPLLIDTAIGLSDLLARLTLLITNVAGFVFSIIALQGGSRSDEVLWWFPIILIIGIVASITIDRTRPSRQISISSKPHNRAS